MSTKQERKMAAKNIRLRADNLERAGGRYFQNPELKKRGLRLMQVAKGMRKNATRILED